MSTATKRTIRPVKASAPKPGPQAFKQEPLIIAPGITIEIEMIDVRVAVRYLEVNESNRSLRDAKVREFARDMVAGDWKGLGDPIRFDRHGKLIDGQHRMEAIVLANDNAPGLRVPFTVVRGLKPEDRRAIDTGTRRTVADQLKMEGHPSPGVLGSAAIWAIRYDARTIHAERSQRGVTHGEIFEYVADHPDLSDSVRRVMNSNMRKIAAPNSKVSCVLYLARRLDEGQAMTFFEDLAEGAGLEKSDPVLALRSRVVEILRHKPLMTNEMWLSLLIRTWNARREGRTMRTIPLLKSGEPIPVPELV